jgi:hypothetical protein
MTRSTWISENLDDFSPQVRELCLLLICQVQWVPHLTSNASEDASYLDTWLNQLWVNHAWTEGRLTNVVNHDRKRQREMVENGSTAVG